MKWKNQGVQLTRSDLDDFENRNGVQFPPGYTNFLLTINGGNPSRNLLEGNHGASTILRAFFSVNSHEDYKDLENEFRTTRHLMREEFFPIADDYLGNYLALKAFQEPEDAIYFIDHEVNPDESSPLLIAKNVEELLSVLRESNV